VAESGLKGHHGGMNSSDNIDTLFELNRQWATSVEEVRPGFFSRLLTQQNPQYLWIGCSDSRVPANEIVGLESGELFVHRNIANVVVHSDLNCLSVMQFALEQLHVKHIMVVGHYRCSGVHAALHGIRIGVSDNWLRHVQDVRDRPWDLLKMIEDPVQQHNALCELNVLEQAVHVCESTVVQDAWTREQALTVHGWVYALHNGLIQDLRFAVSNPQQMQSSYDDVLALLRKRYVKA
jgi:carbonic anhydrase